MPETYTPADQIAANVRAEMARRRVDQGDIAELLGISRPAMSSRLAANTRIRVDELQKIAAYLEVPLEQLLAPASEVSA